MAEKSAPWKLGGTGILSLPSSILIDNYKCTDVGFVQIQGGKEYQVMPTFESSRTTK